MRPLSPEPGLIPVDHLLGREHQTASLQSHLYIVADLDARVSAHLSGDRDLLPSSRGTPRAPAQIGACRSRFR